EAHRQLARAQLRFAQRQLDDLGPDWVRNPVPDTIRPRAMIGQSLDPTGETAIVPAIERGARDAELVKGSPCRQMRGLDRPQSYVDDLMPWRFRKPSSQQQWGPERALTTDSQRPQDIIHQRLNQQHDQVCRIYMPDQALRRLTEPDAPPQYSV